MKHIEYHNYSKTNNPTCLARARLLPYVCTRQCQTQRCDVCKYEGVTLKTFILRHLSVFIHCTYNKNSQTFSPSHSKLPTFPKRDHRVSVPDLAIYVHFECGSHILLFRQSVMLLMRRSLLWYFLKRRPPVPFPYTRI